MKKLEIIVSPKMKYSYINFLIIWLNFPERSQTFFKN
jgi:hypothetical protein